MDGFPATSLAMSGGQYLGVGYGVVGLITAVIYLVVFWRDRSTPKTDAASWLVLVVAATLWPIVLPVSFFKELLPRWRSQSPIDHEPNKKTPGVSKTPGV